MPSKKHDDTAKRIAKKYRTTYNPGKGADVISSRAVVEVETSSTVNDALRQLQGYRKPVYIAGTDKEAIENALKIAKGTTVGVMDNQGKIIKPATRKRN